MDRGELLDRVMNNYRRFYFKKALFSYPWAGSGMRRRYLLGCLKAFLKAGFERKFYDLGKVGYWGPQSRRTVDFHFDRLAQDGRGDHRRLEGRGRKFAQDAGADEPADIKNCGGGDEQMSEEDMEGIDENVKAARAAQEAASGGDQSHRMHV